MQTMPSADHKHIIVVPYDPDWPNVFQHEANLIQEALGTQSVAIHHVGSTSVLGLSAKPIIDIIAIVVNPKEMIPFLTPLGYVHKGEYNIPFRFYFNKVDGQQVNLHMYEEGHPEIELNLCFRNYLREHPNVRDEYGALKEVLLKDPTSFEKNGSMFTNYNLRKGLFIKKILEQAGFNRIRMLRCTALDEWDIYHHLRETLLFKPINIAYDRQHPSMTDPNHHHFVLYQGTNIVAGAQVEFLDDNLAALRSLVIDAIHQKYGYGTKMLNLIEHWVVHHGKPLIKLHSRPDAEAFYRQHGYVDMEFTDPCLEPHYINLGKILC